MNKCGLIGRYGYYSPIDLETVRKILRYEQLREKRPKKIPKGSVCEPPLCKLCSKPLSPVPEGKKGRRRVYCLECQPKRVRLRYKKWWRSKRAFPIDYYDSIIKL
ncbi:hypothetical protein ACFLWV_00495 [Chloroflexota bacterium]